MLEDLSANNIVIDKIIISHFHADHLFGIHVLHDIPFYGGIRYKKTLVYEETPDKEIEKYTPSVVVDKQMMFEYGSHKLELIPFPGHSECTMLIKINERFLHIADEVMLSTDGLLTLPWLCNGEKNVRIEKDREEHGKKPLKDKNDDDCPPPTKNKKKSTTDPDSGVFHKGEHKKVFAYTANTACDKHNYILGFEVAAGNRNDSTIFPSLYKKLKGKYANIKNIVVDAGYKTPAIAKMIYDYVYDEFYDCYIYPNDQILEYSTTNREGYEGYKEYKSKFYKCISCEYISQCTESKNHTKIVVRHVWEEYIKQVEDIQHTRGSKEIYAQRAQTIERVFADAKELHGMRYTKHRGLDKFTMELNRLFTCMNLKKLANRLWSYSLSLYIDTHLLHFFNLFHLYMLNLKTTFREHLFPKGCLSSI